MHNSYDRLAQLLCEVPEYAVEGRLNKNIVAELARKYDAGLINKLLSDKDMKKLFFSESDAGLIFKKDIFLQFISQKEFLPDSYTAFEQKIGLASGGTMLRNDDRVVLNWPYKDCILEGGQTKEDAKRDEVFFNEILAPDEINTILEDKVFTNWKRYDKDGEHELDELKPDDNLIIRGNNLVVLHSLKKRFAGKVKLIYIDPPYNTGNDGFGYNDTFTQSSWLTFMKNRLEVARDLLSKDGLIFISIDSSRENSNGRVGSSNFAYLQVLLDEIFGRQNFISTLIWKKKKQPSFLSRVAGITEPILVYAKDERNVGKLQLGTQTDTTKRIDNISNKETQMTIPAGVKYFGDGKIITAGRYTNKTMSTEFLEDVHIVNGRTVNSFKAIARFRNGQDELNKFAEDDLLYITANNSFRRFKTSEEEESGKTITDLLLDWGQNQDATDHLRKIFNIHDDKKAFDNPKPEQLLGNIIKVATEPGDIIVDFFLGSGTTAAAAHKLGRQYIGIEQMNYIDDVAVTRLRAVISGEDGGISKENEWTGGGSFVYCNIKNDANKFRERVRLADDKKMDDLLDEVLHSSFLSYRIDAKNHNIKLGDFHKLSLADKKHVLLDLIDNNTLYLNYSEIDDATYKISDEDKKHNKAFYGE